MHLPTNLLNCWHQKSPVALCSDRFKHLSTIRQFCKNIQKLVQNIHKCGNIHRYVGVGGNICIGDCATDVRNNTHFHFHSFTISLQAGKWFEEESVGFKVYHWFIMYFLQIMDNDCLFDCLDIWLYKIFIHPQSHFSRKVIRRCIK